MGEPLNKRNQIWNYKFKQIQDFTKSHERWPSTIALDEKEKKLAKWWSYTKYQIKRSNSGCKNIRLSSERLEKVQGLVDKYSHLGKDGIWESRLNAVQKQIEEKEKVVRDYDDAESLQNFRWFVLQKVFLKKYREEGLLTCGMNENRAKKIEDLLARIND